MMFLPANMHRTAMQLTGRTYAGNNPLSKKIKKKMRDTNFTNDHEFGKGKF